MVGLAGRPLARSQKGQSTVEMVLILVTLLGIATLIASEFKNRELFANMVEGPWQQIAGMLEAGVWASPAKARARHPFSRLNTLRGEEPGK